MASFSYEVVDSTGKGRRGSIEADNIDKATAQLKGEGLIIMSIKEQSALNKDIKLDIGGKPKARDFSVFCRQFVAMTRAGVSLIEALGMLSEQTENNKLRDAVVEVRAGVEKGESLTNSMRQKDKIFPSLLISMVEAGEASGSLDISLDRMSTHFEKDAKIKGLIKKAAIYPIVVCIVAVVVVVVMLTTVIPNFTSMFEDMGTELPGITQAVVNMSDFLKEKWYIVIIVAAALVGGFKFFANTSFFA